MAAGRADSQAEATLNFFSKRMKTPAHALVDILSVAVKFACARLTFAHWFLVCIFCVEPPPRLPESLLVVGWRWVVGTGKIFVE